jgi:hypothetical protein
MRAFPVHFLPSKSLSSLQYMLRVLLYVTVYLCSFYKLQ